MENIIYEQFLNGSPEPLSMKSIETILEQIKNSICKIYDGKQGTGFFVKIPFNNIQLPVLLTNNHIIDENDNINKKIITIYLGNENNGKNIKLDGKRKFYTNKDYDTTIIEIKENSDEIKNFLELDDKLMECLSMNKNEIPEFLKNIYLNKSWYILNYPEGKEIVASIAQPGQISGQYINHKCNTKIGSSGSPILLCDNQKVIGVHFGFSNTLKFNKGILIIYSIIDFNQKNNKYIYNKSIDLLHNNSENLILEKIESINEKINNKEIQKRAEKYMKNIRLINLLDDRFIEKNKINCELENIQYDQNLSKNGFNIEIIGEAAYKLYKMCNDIKNGISFDIKKYCKKNYGIYNNSEQILDNIFIIENSGSTDEIGVLCRIKKPLSENLSKIPLLIFSSELFGKKIFTRNKILEDELGEGSGITKKKLKIELNDDSIYYKDKYIIITKFNFLTFLHFFKLNRKFIYLDDFIDINLKEINYSQNICLNQNEILLMYKINFSDINKKIYFVYKEKKYLYESIIEGEEYNNHKKYFIAKKEGIYRIKLIFKNTIKNCNNMFCNLENLIYADVSHLDTNNVNDMSYMFFYCRNLKGINLSSFNTQYVCDMSYMFCGCYSLKNIDLSSFKTANVLDMKNMFMLCKELREIDLKSFNTSKVRSMRSMFKYCISCLGYELYVSKLSLLCFKKNRFIKF